MDTKERLLKLSSLSLRELLLIGTEVDADDDLESESDSLCQCVEALLSEPAPITLPDQPIRTTADYLLDENQPVTAFVLLKNYFKKATTTWQSDLRADAAKVLYYAAIAAAAVYHHTVITDINVTERNDALMYLADCTWMPANLASLFHSAAGRLRDNGLQNR